MEVTEAIRTRRSIRGYKPDPVPMEILKRVLETATFSPSAMNTQPWEVAVITGETLDNVRRANVDVLRSGTDILSGINYQGAYRQR